MAALLEGFVRGLRRGRRGGRIGHGRLGGLSILSGGVDKVAFRSLISLAMCFEYFMLWTMDLRMLFGAVLALTKVLEKAVLSRLTADRPDGLHNIHLLGLLKYPKVYSCQILA